ncbi:MAG: ABC transporter permease [Burkholderiaceae bacterium]
MDTLAALIAATIAAGTPLLLAGIGLLVNERAGVINLGAEGMMLMAAVSGFAAAAATGSVTLGLLAGAAAGMGLALLFAALAVGLATNQYATGLALTLFATGLSAFAGLPLVGRALGHPAWQGLPWLADWPLLGAAIFRQHPMVYVSWLIVLVVAWVLARTRWGLVLRAVGESPQVSHSLGYPVRAIRIAAVLFGGLCCGLAGAYLSLVYTSLWVEGMVAGRGWIALALTAFATWRPWRVLLGAYLFGSVTMIQFHLQGQGVQVASQLLAMLPYLATIVVLVLISRNTGFIRLNMPASLGKPFRPSG